MGWIGEKVFRNQTLIDWVKALGTLAAAIGIFTGVWTLFFTIEKEASDRLLHIITLLDTKNSRTVRAGAVSTMGVYLGVYKKYQDRAYRVMASNLATEDDPLVRDTILNILKGAEADAIEPLACMNRFLLKEETRWQSSFLFDVDLVFQIDLESGCISEELRKEFDNYEKFLSENITVSIAEKDSKWLITDKGNKKIYSIRKDEYSIGIYENDNVTADESSSRTQVDLSNPDDYFSLPEYNDNLFDTIKALVAVLKNGKEKAPFLKESKQDLQDTILSNLDSPSKINLDNVHFEQGNFRNARLKGISLRQANLKQADLSNAVLYRIDLARAHLHGANLDSAFLVETILEGAHLSGALLFSVDSKKFQSDLDKGTIPKGLQQEFRENKIQLANNATLLIQDKGTKYLILSNGKKYRISKEQEKLNIYTDAILENATLESADLRGAYLTNANLVGANLTDANMVKATLQGADLFEADLTKANLAGADLFEADLTRANLVGANLTDANMVNATLQGADFFEADLTDANLVGANLTDANMVNSTLQGADLFEADLTEANLARADLFEADFTDANLAGADLKGAILESANLDGANLEGADLRTALLFGIDPNKFQSDLDKGTISEGFQQEFEDNQISLSKNTTVSVEEKDRRWLINDKDNEQTYTIRKEEHLNIRTVAMIDLTELFGIDSKFQSDLDKGTISEDLKQDLENNGISLSQDTTVSIEEKDRTWLINDKDYGQTYTVRKEDGRLKIYERTKLDSTELFSIDSKKFQGDLDKGYISEDLRQEFKNNWFELSENTAISVKEKGRIWLITDKDYEQTCTVRKEERLNIYKRTKFDFTGIKEAKNWQNAIYDDDIWEKLSSQKD